MTKGKNRAESTSVHAGFGGCCCQPVYGIASSSGTMIKGLDSDGGKYCGACRD